MADRAARLITVANPGWDMTSLAARTREAVREEPFLYDALRAGVVNYTAAARTLDIDGETDAIATALRRYADELAEFRPPRGDVRVSMRSGVGPAEDGDALLTVGDRAFADDGGGYTAIVGTGATNASVLRRVLGTLAAADVDVTAAGVSEEALVVVVERRVGADALRAVEAAVDA